MQQGREGHSGKNVIFVKLEIVDTDPQLLKQYFLYVYIAFPPFLMLIIDLFLHLRDDFEKISCCLHDFRNPLRNI